MPDAIKRHRSKPVLLSPAGNRTGRDADPRRTLALNKATWQKLRASVLAGEPLCRHCQAAGRLVTATDVDHISGNPGDNRLANLQPLCHACHSRKTATDHGKRVATGCDVNGYPLTGAPSKDRQQPKPVDRPVPSARIAASVEFDHE